METAEVQLYSFLTSVLDGGNDIDEAPSALTRERMPVLIEWEARWAPEPVWTFWKRVTCIPPAWFRTPDPPTYLLDGLSCYTDFDNLTPLNSLIDLYSD